MKGDPKVGEILKVKRGSSERTNAKWMEAGDVVRVIGVYPHHVLVEKLKGSNGWHMRQSYSLNCWELDLERVSA